MRAIVVFTDGVGFRSKLLKSGFGHCFCLVDDGQRWVMIDADQGVPFIVASRESSFNVANWYRSYGHKVIETHQRKVAPIAPLAVANCVGMVKALLCIRAPFVLTPYQLYRHLERRHAD